MIRVLTIQNLSGYDYLIFNGPQIQCIRWKRKPIWLPTAKSKLFRVPVKPVIPTEEYKEMKYLFNNYRTYMKSLRHYFIEVEKVNSLQFDHASVKKFAEEDFLKCSEINKIWNEQVAAAREQRLMDERIKRTNDIQLKLKEKVQRDAEIQARVDAEIRKAKEESATFITSDNIDEVIENVMQVIVNHNFAIDFNGNCYTDDSTEKSKTEESIESVI